MQQLPRDGRESYRLIYQYVSDSLIGTRTVLTLQSGTMSRHSSDR